MICRLEWDLLAGPTHLHTLILMPVSLTPCGAGGVAGEAAGVAAGVVGLAGAGLLLTGTIGNKIVN